MSVFDWAATVQRWEEEAAPELWLPMLKLVLDRLTFRVAPPLATAALALDAAELRSEGIPHLFSTNLRRIDPTLNDDLLELYGRSEQVLANRFTFLNIAENYEKEIGWESHRLPEWRAELQAFEFALDLALTYRISGESRYARHLRYLVADWIASNPPGIGSGWQLRPLARRIRNWILAADLARADWEEDPVFLRVVEESLALQAAYLARHCGTAQSACNSLEAIVALQLAGRFFSGAGGARLRAMARTALNHELQTRLRPDGGYIDPQPNIQLRLAMTVMAHLLFDQGQDLAVSRVLEEKLRLILEFLEGMVLPDGNLPLFGPLAQSPGDTLEDLFALAAVRLEEPRWKSLAGRFGMMPYMLLGEEGKASFERLPDCAFSRQPCMRPTSGLYRLCDEGGSALLIKGHAPESDRGHQDFLSYHLSIRGQQVVVDSGAFMPPSNRAPEYFATPLAHNVLLVDGKGPQAVALPPESLIREGRVSGAGYSGLRLRNPGFAFLGLEHERSWFLLDMGAWVVLDRLEGRGAHRIVSLLHFYPTFEIEAGGDQAVARSRSSAATVIPIGRPPRRIVATKGDHPEFPGWYAPDFGIKYPAGVLALEWSTPNSPWVGGYVIAPDDGVKCCAEVMDASSRALSIEFCGRRYALPLG